MRHIFIASKNVPMTIVICKFFLLAIKFRSFWKKQVIPTTWIQERDISLSNFCYHLFGSRQKQNNSYQDFWCGKNMAEQTLSTFISWYLGMNNVILNIRTLRLVWTSQKQIKILITVNGPRSISGGSHVLELLVFWLWPFQQIVRARR